MTIEQLLGAKSTEELRAMTDEERRIYFADAIAAEPPPLPESVIKQRAAERKLKESIEQGGSDPDDDPENPIKIKKKKSGGARIAKQYTLEDIENL